MKKRISIAVFLVCMFVACVVCFTACGMNTESWLINLEEEEIGYEIPIYPDCDFYYEVSEDCVVHIDSMTAVLTEKDSVKEDDILSGNLFYPCEISFSAHGTTSPKLSGLDIYLTINVQPLTIGYYKQSTVDEEGEITWEIDVGCYYEISRIYFSNLSLSI